MSCMIGIEIVRITASQPIGNVSTIAGSTVAGSANGVGTAANLNGPQSIVISANGAFALIVSHSF